MYLGIRLIDTYGGEEKFTFLIVVYLIFSIFGWKALNKITPRVFLILPLIGWVIYFLVKFFLSMIIGTFVTPFVIAKWIANLAQKSLAAQIERDNLSDIALQNPKTNPTEAKPILVEKTIEQPTTTAPSIKEQINQVQLLKEYKELLDRGIITQEEFDEKKKRLLNISEKQSVG